MLQNVDLTAIHMFDVKCYLKAPTGAFSQLVEANPNRVYLEIGVDAGTADATFRNQADASKGIGRTITPGNALERYYERHGPLTCREVWGIGVAGVTTLSIIEVIYVGPKGKKK